MLGGIPDITQQVSSRGDTNLDFFILNMGSSYLTTRAAYTYFFHSVLKNVLIHSTDIEWSLCARTLFQVLGLVQETNSFTELHILILLW